MKVDGKSVKERANSRDNVRLQEYKTETSSNRRSGSNSNMYSVLSRTALQEHAQLTRGRDAMICPGALGGGR